MEKCNKFILSDYSSQNKITRSVLKLLTVYFYEIFQTGIYTVGTVEIQVGPNIYIITALFPLQLILFSFLLQLFSIYKYMNLQKFKVQQLGLHSKM